VHDVTKDVWLSHEILSNGQIEPDVTGILGNAIRNVNKKIVHVLDVGGNIGWITLFALAVDERVRVTVVEPFPWHAKLLRASVKLNGWESRVHLVNKIASDHSGGGACIKPDEENASSTYVMPEFDERLSCEAAGGKFLDITTVDEILKSSPFGNIVDVMKIDVEGYEPLVLEGSVGLLARSPPRTVVAEIIGWRKYCFE
jgi:FkbM family methyltransferase